jgi:hypothetical protein
MKKKNYFYSLICFFLSLLFSGFCFFLKTALKSVIISVKTVYLLINQKKFVFKNLRSDTKEAAAMGGPPIEQNKFKRFCKKYFLEGKKHLKLLLEVNF